MLPLRENTEADLLAAYASGSREALDELVGRYLKPMYGFVFRLLGNQEDAEDVLQETFLRAWLHRQRYRHGESFKAWLYTIARNCSTDLLRKRRRLTISLDAESGDDEHFSLADTLADDAPLPDEITALLQDQERLEKALTKIPPITREIMLLHAEGFAFREIGEMTKKPLDTVKSLYRRALLRLRELMPPGDNAPKPPSLA